MFCSFRVNNILLSMSQISALLSSANYLVFPPPPLPPGFDLRSAQVVSLATGTKCLDSDDMSDRGLTLSDCHAEVVSRRALVRFLYAQLELLLWYKNKNFLNQFSLGLWLWNMVLFSFHVDFASEMQFCPICGLILPNKFSTFSNRRFTEVLFLANCAPVFRSIMCVKYYLAQYFVLKMLVLSKYWFICYYATTKNHNDLVTGYYLILFYSVLCCFSLFIFVFYCLK